MIQTTACVHFAQAKQKLLELTQPNGDPFSQDWVICTHPEAVKWVTSTIAQQRGLCTQLECYPVGRFVNELQSLIWPTLGSLPSLNRLVWATLEGAAQLAHDLDSGNEIGQIFGIADVKEQIQGKEGIEQRRSRRRGQALAGKRLSTAQRFAKILRRLLLTRPHWLQAWDRMDLSTLKPKGKLNEQLWPLLWKEVARVLGPINTYTLRSEDDQLALWSDWLELLCRRVADPDSGLADQVRKLIFFGHHRYDPQILALARACSQVIEVDFITLDPLSYAQFSQDSSDLDERAVPFLSSYGGGFSTYAPTSEQETQDPLWPKPPFPTQPPPLQTRESTETLKKENPTLLNLFQEALSLGEMRPEAPQVVLTSLTAPKEDQSLRFHSSYSDQRQVEDLYQTIRSALRRDPSLRPREILVLCSDIERFAPLILAVFNGDLSSIQSSSALQASVSIAEEQDERLGAELARPHGQNPYAQLLITVLKLSKSRLYRHDVFQCLKHPLVSSRFRLSLSEILKLEQWTRLSGIRWGLDAQHRVSCGLNEEAQHSWEFGLDRLLMGGLVGQDSSYAFGQLYDGVAPIALGDEGNEQILSKFFEFFLLVKEFIPKLSSTHTPAVWCELLIDVLRKLCAAHSVEDKALRQDVEADLRRALKGQAPTQQKMTTKAMEFLIEGGIGQQQMVIGSGRDHVRFYSLDQGYAVPARMICFLNLSEGRFPFRSRLDRLDPIALYPLANDLDPLKEQFANFIASVLAAREQVHFFFTGQKANGEKRLPTPILQALQDELGSRFQLGGCTGESLIKSLTIEHPLHSFSPRNFYGDEEGKANEETLSHEPIWLKGAQAWREAMSDPRLVPPFSARSLDVAARGVSRPKLDTLKQLLKNPSEFFLKRGVGMRLIKDEEQTRERELLELDGLQSWFLKDRAFKLLQDMDPSLELKDSELGDGIEVSVGSPLTEENFAHIVNVIRAEGLLPIGKMGDVSFEQALDEVKSLYERFNQAREHEGRRPLSIQLKLPSGRPLQIEGEMYYGDRLVFTTPSSHLEKRNQELLPRGEKLMEPWLYHVALSAADPEFKGTALVAKDGQFDQFPKLAQAQAASLLESWVDLMEEGSLKPLRFDPELSWKWLSYVSEAQMTDSQGSNSGIEAFEKLTEQWKNADNLYVLQAYNGEQPWRDQSSLELTESMNHSGEKELDLKQLTSNIKGVHSEFIRQSELIFGELSASLHSLNQREELASESKEN